MDSLPHHHAVHRIRPEMNTGGASRQRYVHAIVHQYGSAASRAHAPVRQHCKAPPFQITLTQLDQIDSSAGRDTYQFDKSIERFLWREFGRKPAAIGNQTDQATSLHASWYRRTVGPSANRTGRKIPRAD